MINLTIYIHEALKSKYQKYFEGVYSTMQSLITDNKVQPIKVDLTKIGCPKKPFLYDEYFKDPSLTKIVQDSKVGFTVVNQMMKMPNKYLIDGEKEYKPDLLPFSYQQENNMYLVGMFMYDEKISYVDEFLHIVAVETSLIVSESTPVLKEMIKRSLKDVILKKKEYKGLSAKPEHPKMKAILIKCGFVPFKDNKEILTYKL